MDSSIRSLLHSCRGDNKPESLLEPYEKLKQESDGNVKANVGTDLFVLCAEVACLVSYIINCKVKLRKINEFRQNEVRYYGVIMIVSPAQTGPPARHYATTFLCFFNFLLF
jgi:hypothetical protein